MELNVINYQGTSNTLMMYCSNEQDVKYAVQLHTGKPSIVMDKGTRYELSGGNGEPPRIHYTDGECFIKIPILDNSFYTIEGEKQNGATNKHKRQPDGKYHRQYHPHKRRDNGKT